MQPHASPNKQAPATVSATVEGLHPSRNWAGWGLSTHSGMSERARAWRQVRRRGILWNLPASNRLEAQKHPVHGTKTCPTTAEGAWPLASENNRPRRGTVGQSPLGRPCRVNGGPDILRPFAEDYHGFP
jgi:hypothetical protein